MYKRRIIGDVLVNSQGIPIGDGLLYILRSQIDRRPILHLMHQTDRRHPMLQLILPTRQHPYRDDGVLHLAIFPGEIAFEGVLAERNGVADVVKCLLGAGVVEIESVERYTVRLHYINRIAQRSVSVGGMIAQPLSSIYIINAKQNRRMEP